MEQSPRSPTRLRQFPVDRVDRALVAMLDDERWEVRANAVQALGAIGDRSALADVERLLEDPNPQVRGAAESALGNLR